MRDTDDDESQHKAEPKVQYMQHHTSPSIGIRDANMVLEFFDDASKVAAFNHYWEKLVDLSAEIDFNALRTCVQLLPAPDKDHLQLYSKLSEFVVDKIPKEQDDVERLYALASICLINKYFGFHSVFSDKILPDLTYPQNVLDEKDEQGSGGVGVTSLNDKTVTRLRAYLNFLKCSFWLPPDHGHLLCPEILNTLSKLIGQEGVDEAALDAVSALLSLLSQDVPIAVARCANGDSQSGLSTKTNPENSVLNNLIIDQSLWVQIRHLNSSHFSDRCKLFKIWFQWTSICLKQGIPQEGIYTNEWWQALRIGLLSGFADQHKYALGILRRSLRLAQRNIDTPLMILDMQHITATQKQYEKFSTLYETIVLDRYPNQVQACLPELGKLIRPTSMISPTWTIALLSAALNPKIQDGIRKIIGNWYVNYVLNEEGPIINHATFLLEGFLPWAAQGSLFTSTLVSTRTRTICRHGDVLKDVIVKFIATIPTPQERRTMFIGILDFVLNASGRIFAPSILYFLQGLLEGLRSYEIPLESSDLDALIRVSRLPGFPEIANDLCVTYCAQICALLPHLDLGNVPGYDLLRVRYGALQSKWPDGSCASRHGQSASRLVFNDSSSFLEMYRQLEDSQHQIIQGSSFRPAAERILSILDQSNLKDSETNGLSNVLEALWEEADRQEFYRPVAVMIPPLFFHPACIKACVQDHRHRDDMDQEGELRCILTKAVMQLQRLAEGRSYLLATLTASLRKACFFDARIMEILPMEDFLVNFINSPPSPKKEFLFEVTAAERLHKILPHRDYTSYYGQREWHAYAAIIEILNRFPQDQITIAKRLLRRLLEPWKTQQAPVPIISKWKDVFQLQAMLILADSCISGSDAKENLSSFMHALVVEQWPRYRYLLEWIIARIYFRFPHLAPRILVDLAKLDDTSPIHIASLLKIAILSAQFLNSEDFALKLTIQLIPFSASPKVHIRHEAHWSFPIIFGLSECKGWASITGNSAFQALNNHVRSLDKFNVPPSTIRTLKLDAVDHYTLTEIFQGQYLSIETPEVARVAREDFISLRDGNNVSTLEVPPTRVPLGESNTASLVIPPSSTTRSQSQIIAGQASSELAFFQTKSGFDLDSILPPSNPLLAKGNRPASVILIASLIDNPTNLGGLSRISESFGLESLYIDDLKKIAHKDFKATSVTSEKHLSIRELKIDATPAFLLCCKRQGYTIVGIEQTDRSGILGNHRSTEGIGESREGLSKVNGLLPKKCVLVLGSEKGGITAGVLSVLDRCVEIRTVGFTRSLNVQTAGGIAVYEWWREWGMNTCVE